MMIVIIGCDWMDPKLNCEVNACQRGFDFPDWKPAFVADPLKLLFYDRFFNERRNSSWT